MENQIFITHFVHPHKFWYKPFHPGSQKKKLKELQDAIDDYCDQHHGSQQRKHYEVNELVGYYIPSLTRWTRCTVQGITDDMKGLSSYHLWLIDEGYPTVASGTQQLTPLPEKFRDTSNSLVKCGLIRNVLPASCVYDPLEDQIRKAECLAWSKDAIKILSSLIEGIEKICFTNVVPYMIGKEAIDFGDLLFHSKTKTFNAVNVLSDQAVGLIVDSKHFLDCIFENRSACTSRASSVVNGSLDDSASFGLKVKTRKDSIDSCGVNDFNFDDSVSMVGAERKQPVPVPISAANSIVSATGSQRDDGSNGGGDSGSETSNKKVSKLNQKIRLKMAQKLKNATVPAGKQPSPAKPDSTQAMDCPKTIPDESFTQPLHTQIRMDPHSLTIDVAQSIEAEYELMHAQSTNPTPAEVKRSTANETVPKQPQDPPPTTKQITNETSGAAKAATPGGNGSVQKILQKIAKAKARQAQQKQPVPVTEQQSPGPPVKSLDTADALINSLSPSERLPTVESNAALKRFEKVIQNEKW